MTESKVEKEITELAESIYAFNLGTLTPKNNIQAIKHNIQSFLLANHYVQLSEDQSLPEIEHQNYTSTVEQLARDHYEAGWNNGVNNAYRLGFRRIKE